MSKTLKNKHIQLKVKQEKIIELEKFAPKVKDLIAQLDDIPIAELSDKPINIKQITLLAADKEELLKQTNNPGIELEVYVVPSPPKPQ